MNYFINIINLIINLPPLQLDKTNNGFDSEASRCKAGGTALCLAIMGNFYLHNSAFWRQTIHSRKALCTLL